MVETLPCENHEEIWAAAMKRKKVGINIDKDRVAKTPAKILDAQLTAWSHGYEEYIPIVEKPAAAAGDYGLSETKPNIILEQKRRLRIARADGREYSDDTTESRRFELEGFFARIKDMLYSENLTFEKE